MAGIEALRKAKGWTIAQLAARANVRQAVIIRAEDNPENLSAGNGVRIARALGVEPHDLISIPSPELENDPEWSKLRENLLRWHPKDRSKFLVWVNHMFGKEEMHRKLGR